METIIRQICGDIAADSEVLARAAGVLSTGGLVAFPTETVYGLGADASDPAACRRIYEAKGRPSDNPLIVHVPGMEDAETIAEVDERARALMSAFWPGPLTLVMKKKNGANISDVVTGGLDTVAVRAPSHETARRLLAESGLLIAAPSANISGRPSPTHSSHVIEDMKGRIDMIIVDDTVDVGIESTILDLSSDTPAILRPGVITAEDIETVLGADVTFTQKNAAAESPKAPGMKYRHYAPKAEMTVFCGDRAKCAEEMKRRAQEQYEAGKRVYILASDESADTFTRVNVISLGSRRDMRSVASALFAALRKCDDEGADVIFAEGFEETDVGAAVMNRLLKAAGHNIIER